jgi:two-component system, chemotaxis family, sensor kinase CheA
MIEDQELRALFRTESEEHLHQLEDGLLRLEKNPTDQTTLEEVFRGAHSLKGGA